MVRVIVSCILSLYLSSFLFICGLYFVLFTLFKSQICLKWLQSQGFIPYSSSNAEVMTE